MSGDILYSVCKEEYFEINCILNISSLCIIGVLLLLNTYSFIRMCKSLGKIKFENYVIISGIIELCIYIFVIVIKNEYFINIIEFLQLLIMLFITRRFLKSSFRIRNRDDTNCYNYFFVIFAIINLITALIILIFMYLEINDNQKQTFENRNHFLQIFHNSFSFLSSLILFKIGWEIRTQLQHIQLTESSIFGIHTSFKVNRSTKLSSEINESVTLIRITQINIIIYTFLISSLLKFSYTILKYFIMKDHFSVENGYTNPQTITSSIVHFVFSLSVISPVLMNYIAFFYIIKDNYRTDNNINSHPKILAITSEEISRIGDDEIRRQSTNQDLNNYFKL